MTDILPLVSVCMITYNHESYIREAIEGVLKQKCTFKFELIIGEDYGTDNTRKICEEYARQFPQINLLASIRNLGIIPNFSKTLNACTGQYIAICEGDDYWIDPLKLQKQVDFLEKNNDYALVFTDADILYNDSGRIIKSFDRTNGKKIPTGNVFPYLIHSPNPYKTCTALFKRSSIMNYDDIMNGEHLLLGDVGLWLYISSKEKIGYINESTAVYRVLQHSAQHFRSFNEFMKFGKEAREIRYFWAKKFNFEISHSKILYMKYRSILIYWIKRIGLKK